MSLQPPSSRRRGRPPKQRDDQSGTRDLMLRSGLEILTEKGFSATGIDEILGRVGIPKGSFYHYFSNKEDFGLKLIDLYADFFAKKLDYHFCNSKQSPLERLRNFVQDAKGGMARYEYRRGCLIGNLGQEMGALPESFRSRLKNTFEDWQYRLARCLDEAKMVGEISASVDTGQFAASFWIGWEGAVLRAKLERSVTPLDVFAEFFFGALPRG